jgi:hypothetical protein
VLDYRTPSESARNGNFPGKSEELEKSSATARAAHVTRCGPLRNRGMALVPRLRLVPPEVPGPAQTQA